MTTALAIVISLTAAANVIIAIADFTRAKFVIANSIEVGVPLSWLPLLATLKLAGGLGLLSWFVHVPLLPVAAAGGLVCFFVGACAAHLRAKVYGNLAFPVTYLALATTSLTLLLSATSV